MAAADAELAQLPLRPRLKPWYRLATTTGGIVLRYGASVLEFGGGAAAELLPRLLPLLDGTHTQDELVVQLGEPVRPAVEHMLDVLATHGLLMEPLDATTEPARAETAEFLSASDPFRREASTIATALAERTVAVVGTGGVAELLFGLLAPVVETAWIEWGNPAAHSSDLAVAAPASAETPLLADWNRAALERRTEWLPVLPFDGQLAAVGPLVVPLQSACYECFALRREACISPVAATGTGSFPSAAPAEALLAGYAAIVALRRVALGDGAPVGVLLAVEHGPELVATRHVVHRVPRCPVCSPSAQRAVPSPWNEVHGIAA